jgi:hypothetical protein
MVIARNFILINNMHPWIFSTSYTTCRNVFPLAQSHCFRGHTAYSVCGSNSRIQLSVYVKQTLETFGLCVWKMAFVVSTHRDVPGGSNMTGTNCDLFTHKLASGSVIYVQTPQVRNNEWGYNMCVAFEKKECTRQLVIQSHKAVLRSCFMNFIYWTSWVMAS